MSATRERRPFLGAGRRPRLGRSILARHLARLDRAALRRRLPRLIALLAVLLAVLAGGWLWFRDSSLVAVRSVRIEGVTGPDARQIERALRQTALGMTTLDVNLHQLQTAVQPYPDVRTVAVQTHFPHGITIDVTEQVPVAAISINGHQIAVAQDGTLLPASISTIGLPVIPLDVPPAGVRLNEPSARAALAVIAAAPYALLSHLQNARATRRYGVVVQVRGGPQLRFGPVVQLRAKWDAVIAVLAAPSSRGAAYIDVSDPSRPAAGGPGFAGSSSGSPASASTAATSGAAVTATSPAVVPQTAPGGGVGAGTASTGTGGTTSGGRTSPAAGTTPSAGTTPGSGGATNAGAAGGSASGGTAAPAGGTGTGGAGA